MFYPIPGWRVVKVPHGWDVEKEIQRQPRGGGDPVARWVFVGFFPTLAAALPSLGEHALQDPAIKTAADAIERLRKIGERMEGIIAEKEC